MEGHDKVTYTTTQIDDESLHTAFDQSVQSVIEGLGGRHFSVVAGHRVSGSSSITESAPGDRDVEIGSFDEPPPDDVDRAVASAKAGFKRWARTPWEERATLLSQAAKVIGQRRFDLAALIAVEVGKPRLEALGDVDETIELIRLYCERMREQDGYRIAMTEPSSPEEATSLLRPYGVWAVISPFNFPLPLAAGPAAAALVTGNTVILKPSYQGYLSTLRLYEAFVEAGLPEDALHVLTGSGRRVGAQLVGHADVNGITFTGSHEVGMQILRTSADRDSPRPSICEMGGKNATIVSGAGDLDAAAMGVARAAFGYSGQKCSACSRVYVEDRVADDFLNRLCEVTSSLKVSNPVRRDAFTGPVINARAVGRFREAVTEAKRVGRVLAGGAVMEGPDTPSDQYLELTVAEVPTSSYLMEQELFLPFVAVQRVSSFNEALPRLNQGTLGLTAGLFSEDADEIATFLDEAQAGVLYVNRSAGATTGAWPGIQSFSGWRGSGTTSRGTGGYYYVQQYMREQSRTIMH